MSKKDYTTLDEFNAAVSEKVAKRVKQLQRPRARVVRPTPKAAAARQVVKAAEAAGWTDEEVIMALIAKGPKRKAA